MTQPTPDPKAIRDKAIQWIDQRAGGTASCPACGKLKFEIGDPVELRPFAGGALVAGGPVFVMVPLECKHCAHVMLFNAMTMGIL